MISVEGLERLCIEAYLARSPGVTLTLPKKVKGQSSCFPRGELLSVNAQGERNYRYDPLKLMAWLRQHAWSAA